MQPLKLSLMYSNMIHSTPTIAIQYTIHCREQTANLCYTKYCNGIHFLYVLYTVTTTTPSKPHPQVNPQAMPEVAAAIVHSIPPVRRHVYLSEQKAKKKRYRQSLNLERLSVPPSMVQRSCSVEATVDVQEEDTRPPSE